MSTNAVPVAPYRSHFCCPKCKEGGSGVTRAYERSIDVLVCRCASCGYTWPVACADAATTKGAAPRTVELPAYWLEADDEPTEDDAEDGDTEDGEDD